MIFIQISKYIQKYLLIHRTCEYNFTNSIHLLVHHGQLKSQRQDDIILMGITGDLFNKTADLRSIKKH